ncbi:MAG: aquaporin [bacterium]
MNTNKISYNKYLAEIIGALLLVLVVALSGSGLSVIIFAAIAYAFIVYLFGEVSGAHANPAFTIAAWTMKKIKWQDALLYICAQLIGAGIALIILKNITGFQFTNINAIDGLTIWAILKSEIIGTAIFAMAFAAALHGKATKSNVGLVLGFGLFFGLLFANMAGGVGVLNPAVAIGANLLNWATIVGPIIGALIGAWLYRFIVLGNLCGCGTACDSTCGCGFCHKNKAMNNEPSPEVIVVEEVDVLN